jgi:hypothetical protein
MVLAAAAERLKWDTDKVQKLIKDLDELTREEVQCVS